jgi:hypothetical protein
MDKRAYTLEPGQKATQVMIGSPDMLVWGDLITREQVRVNAFINTLAEDFVPLHDTKILFLAPVQQVPPVQRARVHMKLEEILFFYSMGEPEPPPQESETRRYEPVEILLASYQIEGSILKSPIADLHTMLLVAKETYIPIYQATIRHVAKTWLGTLSTNLVQVRMGRMTVTVR